MAKVKILIATAAKPLPAGVTAYAGQRLFKLGDLAQIVNDVMFEFDDVVDGTYTASCQSLDQTGAPIDDLVSCEVLVQTPATGGGDTGGGDGGQPTTTYDAPASISATVTY